MNYSQSVVVTADTLVTSTPALIRSVILAGGADASRVVIRDGVDATGTAKAVLVAAAGASASWTAAAPEGVICGKGVFIDLTAGTTPDITLEYEGIR